MGKRRKHRNDKWAHKETTSDTTASEKGETQPSATETFKDWLAAIFIFILAWLKGINQDDKSGTKEKTERENKKDNRSEIAQDDNLSAHRQYYHSTPVKTDEKPCDAMNPELSTYLSQDIINDICRNQSHQTTGQTSTKGIDCLALRNPETNSESSNEQYCEMERSHGKDDVKHDSFGPGRENQSLVLSEATRNNGDSRHVKKGQCGSVNSQQVKQMDGQYAAEKSDVHQVSSKRTCSSPTRGLSFDGNNIRSQTTDQTEQIMNDSQSNARDVERSDEMETNSKNQPTHDNMMGNTAISQVAEHVDNMPVDLTNRDTFDKTNDGDQNNSDPSEIKNVNDYKMSTTASGSTCTDTYNADLEERNQMPSTDIQVDTDVNDEFDRNGINILTTSESKKDQLTQGDMQDNRGMGPNDSSDEYSRHVEDGQCRQVNTDTTSPQQVKPIDEQYAAGESGVHQFSSQRTWSLPTRDMGFDGGNLRSQAPDQTEQIMNDRQSNAREVELSDEMMESTSKNQPTRESMMGNTVISEVAEHVDSMPVNPIKSDPFYKTNDGDQNNSDPSKIPNTNDYDMSTPESGPTCSDTYNVDLEERHQMPSTGMQVDIDVNDEFDRNGTNILTTNDSGKVQLTQGDMQDNRGMGPNESNDEYSRHVEHGQCRQVITDTTSPQQVKPTDEQYAAGESGVHQFSSQRTWSLPTRDMGFDGGNLRSQAPDQTQQIMDDRQSNAREVELSDEMMESASKNQPTLKSMMGNTVISEVAEHVDSMPVNPINSDPFYKTNDGDQNNSDPSKIPNTNDYDMSTPESGPTCSDTYNVDLQERHQMPSTGMQVDIDVNDEFDRNGTNILTTNDSSKVQLTQGGMQDNRGMGPNDSNDEYSRHVEHGQCRQVNTDTTSPQQVKPTDEQYAAGESGVHQFSSQRTWSSPTQDMGFDGGNLRSQAPDQTQQIMNDRQSNAHEVELSDEMMESTSKNQPTRESMMGNTVISEVAEHVDSMPVNPINSDPFYKTNDGDQNNSDPSKIPNTNDYDMSTPESGPTCSDTYNVDLEERNQLPSTGIQVDIDVNDEFDRNRTNILTTNDSGKVQLTQGDMQDNRGMGPNDSKDEYSRHVEHGQCRKVNTYTTSRQQVKPTDEQYAAGESGVHQFSSQRTWSSPTQDMGFDGGNLRSQAPDQTEQVMNDRQSNAREVQLSDEMMESTSKNQPTRESMMGNTVISEVAEHVDSIPVYPINSDPFYMTNDGDQNNSDPSKIPNMNDYDMSTPGSGSTCSDTYNADLEERNQMPSTGILVDINVNDEFDRRGTISLANIDSHNVQLTQGHEQDNRDMSPDDSNDEGSRHVKDRQCGAVNTDTTNPEQVKQIDGHYAAVEGDVHQFSRKWTCSSPKRDIEGQCTSEHAYLLRPEPVKCLDGQDEGEKGMRHCSSDRTCSSPTKGIYQAQQCMNETQKNSFGSQNEKILQLDSLEKKINALLVTFKDETDSQTLKLKQVKNELKLLQNYIDDTHKKVQEKNEAIEKLQKEHEHLVNRMYSKNTELVHYKEKSKVLTDQVNTLSASINDKTYQVDGLNKQLVTTMHEQEQYKTDFLRANESILQKTEMLDELETRLAAEIQLRKDIEGKLKEFETRIKLEQELSDLQQILAGKMKELNDIVKTIDAHGTDLHGIRCKKPMEQEIKQMTDIIVEKDCLLQEQTNQVESLKSEILAKDMQVESTRRQVEDLQRSLEQTKSAILSQERENQSLKNGLTTIQTSLSAKDENLKHCTSRIEYLQGIIEEKQTKRKTQLKQDLLKLKEYFTDKAERSTKQTDDLERIINALQSFKWRSNSEHSIKDLEEMLESINTPDTDNTQAKLIQDILASIQALLENEIGENTDLKTASSIPEEQQNKCDQCHIHMLKIRRFELKLREVEAERNNALTRLNELMSSKLQDSNPNTVDLNDQFRPSKLAEMFNELYNNEWTAAFDCLDGNYNDKFIISFLLDIIMDLHYLCKRKFGETWTVVGDWFLDENFQGYQNIRKTLLEFGKMKVWDLVPAVKQVFIQQLLDQCSDRIKMILTDDSMGKFIEACTRLCLLMASNDPPVVFYCPGWTQKTARQDKVDDLSRRFGSIPVNHSTPGSESTTTLLHESRLSPEYCSNFYNENATLSPGHQYTTRKTTQPTHSWRESSTEYDDSSDDEERKAIRRHLRSSKSKRKRQALDNNIFKEYTRQGRYIEYIVWPAMLLQVQGPLLSKGVAQGTNDKHCYVEVNPVP